jgi:hypothetical protein
VSTPEGKVKDAVKALLNAFDIFSAAKAGSFPETAQGWFFMPSQNGYGVKGVPDFVGHHKGRFFAVETKAPGKKATGFQALQINAINTAGSVCFVIDGDLGELNAWLRAG